MSSIDKELIAIIRRIKNRMHIIKLMDFLLLGIAAALIVSMAVIVAARYLPVYNPYRKAVFICGTGALAAVLFGLFKRPSSLQTALRVDRLGLKERTVTAIELVGQQTAFAQLEKQDALLSLKKVNYKKGIPLKPNRRYLIACIVLIMVVALSGFIPNPMEERAEELHKLKKKIEAKEKKLDERIKQIKSDPKLSEKEKQELLKQLRELKKELKTAQSEKEMDKALKKAEKKLELLKAEQLKKQEQLNKIADALAKNQTTKSLSDMLKNKNAEAIKHELKELVNKIKNMSEADAKQLAENLAKLAQELKDNPELAKALSELANKMASGDLGNLSNELKSLSEAMEQLMSDEDMQQAIAQLSQQLQSMQSSQSQGNNSAQSDDGHQSSGNKGSQGNGSGAGQGNQGGQQGSNGQGKGAGGGAGNGTDMGTENPTPVEPGSSGISKKDGSQRKEGEYEKIFTSKTLGGDGEQSNLSGQKNQGGNTEQTVSDKSQTVRGDSVPYNQVLGQYSQSALDSLNTSDIPPGMKDIVKEYFTSLEE